MENKQENIKKTPRLRKRILQAFQGKYEGKKYEDIATETKYSIKTLYTNFQKNGVWYQLYLDYEKDLNDEIIRQAKEVLRKEGRTAATIMVAALAFIKSDPRLAVDAAKDVLDRVGLKPAQDINLKDRVEDVTEEMLTALEGKKTKEQNEK